MDLGRIELPPWQCECHVIPLDYRPELVAITERSSNLFWTKSLLIAALRAAETERSGGQKGRGLGGRNFCPPASVPVPFEKRKSGRGVWGEFRHARAKSNCGQPRRPARSEQNPAQKFSFPFRRKKSARANQKMWRKLFCGVARFPSDGGAGFLIGGFAQKMFEFRSKNTASLR